MANNILQAHNIRVSESGERYIVLGHGMGTDQSVWNRLLPFFTGMYRVIRYDLACAGSMNPDSFDIIKYSTLDGYVDDLLNILDALGVDRCVFCGSLHIRNDWNLGFHSETSALLQAHSSLCFPKEMFAAMEANYEAWVYGTIVNTDIRSVLGQVRVPCCIIHTARDASVPLSAAEYLRNHLGGRTTLQILNTEGHLPHLSAPALTGRAICRALPR
ncbi:hypothetical protein Pint_28353 [Pistacia integerrima]|uniref:Uncharacterized protein n=1 Tax=Pistacia integerrima TaxID=434235 RepID=A0ACC0YSS7_9ROSI|nr:hypothetical protein Pint_28353 [Pistacia integerrima]